MKAKELIEILKEYPDANVLVEYNNDYDEVYRIEDCVLLTERKDKTYLVILGAMAEKEEYLDEVSHG
jgi:hypothetical protein